MGSDLARTLAAHPRFRWAEGMRTTDGRTILLWNEGAPAGIASVMLPTGEIVGRSILDAEPDLADAATAGVLLDMLADAMPLRAVQVIRERPNLGTPYRWWVESYTGAYLGEAAARALLALWSSEVSCG